MKALLVGILAFSSAVSAADVTVKNGMELLAINGRSVENYGDGADKRVQLAPGEYQVVARYENDLERGAKSVLFTSKPYLFYINVGSDDLVVSVPKMKFESHANAFFKDPKIKLENVSTDTSETLAVTRLQGKGFGSHRNVESAVAQYNKDNGIVFEGGAPQDLEELVVAIDDKGNVDIKGDTMTQLKLWYTKATTEEKKAFKRWMIDQDF